MIAGSCLCLPQVLQAGCLVRRVPLGTEPAITLPWGSVNLLLGFSVLSYTNLPVDFNSSQALPRISRAVTAAWGDRGV